MELKIGGKIYESASLYLILSLIPQISWNNSTVMERNIWVRDDKMLSHGRHGSWPIFPFFIISFKSQTTPLENKRSLEESLPRSEVSQWFQVLPPSLTILEKVSFQDGACKLTWNKARSFLYCYLLSLDYPNGPVIHKWAFY